MRRGLLPLLLLSACSPGAAPVQAPSGGIASINPCTDAILVEVADRSQISALSAYSADPASSSMDVSLARALPATTGTAEELAALRPALVIGSNFTAPATRKALQDLHIPLVEVPIARTVEESEAQIRQIARLAGRPQRGEALIARIEAALAAAAPHSAARPSALVWQSGGIVAGPDTLIADLLARTGFSSHAAAAGLKQADYLPLERVLAHPPQVILAAGSPRAGENRFLSHPALAGLTGTRLETFDSSLLWCAGPSIVPAAARLAELRASMDKARP